MGKTREEKTRSRKRNPSPRSPPIPGNGNRPPGRPLPIIVLDDDQQEKKKMVQTTFVVIQDGVQQAQKNPRAVAKRKPPNNARQASRDSGSQLKLSDFFLDSSGKSSTT